VANKLINSLEDSLDFLIYDMIGDFQLQNGDFVYVLIDHESLKAFSERLKSLGSAG